MGPVKVIGPRPGQSVRNFFSSSIDRPGQSWLWECDIVSITTVSPESTIRRGSSALSNQPHCVVSRVAGNTCTRPGHCEAATFISFCMLDSAIGGLCAFTPLGKTTTTRGKTARSQPHPDNGIISLPFFFFPPSLPCPSSLCPPPPPLRACKRFFPDTTSACKSKILGRRLGENQPTPNMRSSHRHGSIR